MAITEVPFRPKEQCESVGVTAGRDRHVSWDDAAAWKDMPIVGSPKAGGRGTSMLEKT